MWNDLTMRERADLIRQGVALGYKDIDSIRNNYHSFGGGSTLNSSYQDPNPYYNRLDDKHKKEWRSLSAQRKKFNQMLQQYSPQIYNDPQLRNTMEFIAFNEGRWVRPTKVPEKSGATGYFQLTPPTIRTYNQEHNTNYSTKDPAQDFAMMQYTVQTSMDNINKLLKDPTFRRKAQELGWDQYDLLKASWLLGPTGMKNHVLDPKRYNPKDEYGSSASSYVKNNNSTGDDVMVVNRGVEQPPAILITPEDVRRQLEEEQNPPVQINQNEVQPTEPVSDTLLQDQYERLVQENAELSQADQEMKEKWNQMMENVQAEQERQNIVSMINTLGWQNAQPITPVQGQITNDERVYNNPVLAAQMYNRRNNRISNGSFGKYFFNGQEDNTPMILGYNPYSPVMAFGGPVHRYDLAGTVNTPYSNNNPEQKRIPYQWYNNPRHQQLMEERLKGVSPLDDPDAPAQPIQSHYQVNPVYWGNTTVQGEPVNITGYKDNKTGIAQYQDGEYGYVNLPENYGMYMMDGITVTPERSALRNLVQDYVTQENDTLISPLLGAGDSEIQPIKFSDASAEPYKAQDLDRFFANLITGGLAGTEEEAARQFKKGNYGRGVFLASLPAAGISGWPGHLIRGTQLAYNLGSDEGIPKSIDMFNDNNALGWMKSVTGDLLSIPLTGLELGNGVEGFNNNVLLPTAYTRTLPGYYARTALDLQRNPLTTLKAIGKGDYIHNYSSLRKAVEQARKEIEKGTTHTQNYYQNALKVDIPRPEIDVRTKIDADDPVGQFNHNTNRTAYKLYKNSTSNLTRKPQEYQFTGGHEGTHYTEQYLHDRYGFPQTSKYVWGDEYYTPNENHPIMYNGRIQEFMEAPEAHGKSPEETWANFLGHKAANIEQPFDEFNMYQEGIQSPYLFIPEMERYIKELSPKALQKEGEIQLFNKVYGNKALGGTISGNSDSMILANNNNYIQDFKGRQYGLPTVRYDKGGPLVQQANMFRKGGTTTGPEVVITPDEEYNRFLNTLPDNQRLTPNEDYDTYLYWKLKGKPKDFQEALDRGMYVWDDSDHSYHGNSIAWGDDGTGYFIKPKHHDTLKYELDWFNKNIITEPGGHQRFETPEERAESDKFRENYVLADDPNRPDFYIYKPKDQAEGLNTYERQNDISIKEKALGGHLFGNGGDGRTTLPHIGDSWRNTETGESGTVVGYAPDVPYMGEDGKLYSTTSPVVKYDSGETLFGVTPQYTLPEITATGHLRTPADDLDKVMLGTLAAGVAPMALPEIASGATTALANPYVDAALTSYFGAHGINDIVNGNANAMTALEVLPMARLAKPLWNAGKSASKAAWNYASNVVDNVARRAYAPYDLYRTIEETTPRAFPRTTYFSTEGLLPYNHLMIDGRLNDFANTRAGLETPAYFFRAPKKIDVLKLKNGSFRAGNYGNDNANILPSGHVDGKFVSYGEPWGEFGFSDETSALYEFPVGEGRSAHIKATDWRGNTQDYTAKDAYEYTLQQEELQKELDTIKETIGWDNFKYNYAPIRKDLIERKYPLLKKNIDTRIYFGNQTVIPNSEWNFESFLKEPFWKYTTDEASGQVQRELFMPSYSGPKESSPTISWEDAINPNYPEITAENAVSITPEQWTAAQDAAIARGDMVEAQRLSDLHADINGYNSSIPLFHGTDTKFTEFDINKFGKSDAGNLGRGFYITPHYEAAYPYAKYNDKDVMRLYTNVKHPANAFEVSGADLAMIGEKSVDDAKSVVKKWIEQHKAEDIEGYHPEMLDYYNSLLPEINEDRLAMLNSKYDSKMLGDNLKSTGELATTKSSQMKLADAVTYDKGIRIPLGNRHNSNIDDIRYGLIPLGIGAAGYGLYNNFNSTNSDIHAYGGPLVQ